MEKEMMNKWLSIAMAALVLLMAFSVSMASAQELNSKDKRQMRQLAYDSCVKNKSEQVCACFADRLQSDLNEQDWQIFIADYKKSASLPSGISGTDIDAYGRKLAAAGNACGL